MKALVLEEYNKLVYKDFDKPKIGLDDVSIKVKACGICGSDVHGMDGSTGRRQPLIIMGHEASGEIVETGGNVPNWYVVDRDYYDSDEWRGTWEMEGGGVLVNQAPHQLDIFQW